MPTSIDVVPQGWWTLADADGFYPEDLPRDWQLTYFANVFPAVLVPATLWQHRSDAELAAWRADVHAGFRFYLASTSTTEDSARARAIAALGSALHAFVDGERDETGTADPASVLLAPRTGRRIGAARHCPAALNGDPRGARGWLAAQAEPPQLVILDRPRSTELDAWHDLLALLGLQ